MDKVVIREGVNAVMDGLLRAWIDAFPEPMLLLEAVRDEDGSVVDFIRRDFNRATHEMFGVTRADLLGSSVVCGEHRSYSQELLTRLRDCVNTGEAVELNETPYDRDDPSVYADIQIARVGVDLLAVASRNVSDRVDAVHRLAAAEEQYRLLAENSVDVVAHVGGDGLVRWVSPSVESMLGAPPRHWVGSKAIAGIAPADRAGAEEINRRVLSGATELQRVRLLDAHGDVHWVEAHSKPFHDRAGELDGYIVFLRLLDDRVALEQERDTARQQQAGSDARFRRLMETSNVGMAIGQPGGKFEVVNQALCDLLGYDETALKSKTWQDLTPATFLNADLKNVEDLVAGRIDTYRVTKQLIRSAGDPVWIDLSVSCLRDATGAVEYLFAQIVDINEQVKSRAEQADADARFRRLMETSNVGMVLATAAGKFEVVNQALCEQLGYDEETLKTKSWQDLTPACYMEDDLRNIEDLLAGRIDTYRLVKQHIRADGTLMWIDLSVSCLRDSSGAVEYLFGQIIDVDEQVESRARQAEADARFRRLMETSNVGMVLATAEGKFEVLNRAFCEQRGYDEETLKTKTWRDITPVSYWADDLKNTEDLLAGRIDTYRVIKQHIHADGHLIWIDLSVSCLRGADGEFQYFAAQSIDITEQVELRAKQAEADARFRRLMETSNVAMAMMTPDGRLEVVNQTLCRLLGYDEATIRTKTWQDLTPASYLEADLKYTEELLAGELDTHRLTKQFIHADGHLIWADLSVSCLRDANGAVQYLVAQGIDVTAEVEAREQLAQQEKQNRELAQRLADELSSAALYVTSILPGELEGPVRVTAEYLPSQRLGGDSFDYRWLDDDHLMAYLIDVSGHGVDAALLSVSVHNILRTGTLSPATLLAPEKVLTELNRLFQMKNQGNRFFTIWYGVYQKSTRQLRYASAGHPPALAFELHGNTATATALSTKCLPIGVMADADFVADVHRIPHGGKLLVFSDGAYELIDTHGQWWSLEKFIDMCTECAAQDGCSLDTLVARIQHIAADGNLLDDCALIQLSFD